MKWYCPDATISLKFFGCSPNEVRRAWFERLSNGAMHKVEAEVRGHSVVVPDSLCEGVWVANVKTDCKCVTAPIGVTCGVAAVEGTREVTNERYTAPVCCEDKQ